jgi:vacuolar-type H+-ATPase subunit H
MSLEINKLLEIEREAENRIKEARAEAEKIISEARRRASEIIKEAEAKEFEELTKEYMDKILVKKEEILSSYKKEAEEISKRGISNLDKAVEHVLKWVLGVD